jgi:carbohydrate-selective porin OprB
MKPARIATLCLLALLIMCGAPLAQNQGPWWTWSTFDGNWGGYRQTLADEGVAVSGSTIVDLLGNVSGPVRAFAPANASLVAVDADLEKLLGLKGLLLHSEFVANAGENFRPKALAICFRSPLRLRSPDTISVRCSSSRNSLATN